MREPTGVTGVRKRLRVGLTVVCKIANDVTTVGAGNTRIVIKTDTEPAIVDLRNTIVKTHRAVASGFDES